MNKLFFTLLIICVCFCFAGCDFFNDTPNSHNEVLNSSMNSSISGGDIVIDRDDFIVDSNDVLIYKISRDTCQEFLNQPSYEFLQNNNLSIFSYVNKGEWFVTSDGTRFHIDESFIDFLQTKIKTKEYLKQNSVKGDIEHVVIFNAPHMPITLWIKTTEENCYITINEEPEDTSYVYRFYSQINFNNKYVCKKGKLLVDSKEIITENIPKIYNNYADIPFLAVMKSMGANVRQQNETQFLVSFKNKVYTLDIQSCALYIDESTKENLFNKVDGGTFFKYSVTNDVMVDNTTLGSVLYDMGQKVSVEIDSNNSYVLINRNTGDEHRGRTQGEHRGRFSVLTELV